MPTDQRAYQVSPVETKDDADDDVERVELPTLRAAGGDAPGDAPATPTAARKARLTEARQMLDFRAEVDGVRRRLAKTAKNVILPHSKGMQRWDVCTLVALVFTAIVTPVEVAFCETALNALFVINRGVDLVFVADMVVNFYLAYSDERGMLVQSVPLIARRYLRSWFAIDLFSILPFDVLALTLNSPKLQKLKAIRLIRLLRLLKLVRVLKASQERARVPSRFLPSLSPLGTFRSLSL